MTTTTEGFVAVWGPLIRVNPDRLPDRCVLPSCGRSFADGDLVRYVRDGGYVCGTHEPPREGA